MMKQRLAPRPHIGCSSPRSFSARERKSIKATKNVPLLLSTLTEDETPDRGIMDISAVEFLKRTITLIISSSPLLSRLLLQQELQQDMDLECQYAKIAPDDHHRSSQFSSPRSEQPCLSARRDRMEEYTPLQRPESRIQPLDETTRVLVLNAAYEKRLALLVTEDLVYRTEKVVNYTRELQHQEKLCRSAEKEIVNAMRLAEQIKDEIGAPANADNVDELKRQLYHHETVIDGTRERQDSLARDLAIMQDNLAYAKDASHNFLLELFEHAGLLQQRDDESKSDHIRETPIHAHSEALSSEAETIVMTEEESYNKQIHKELGEASNELEDAERIFNNLERFYDDQADDYEAEMAKGEMYMPRSEFDRFILENSMHATTRLVNAQKVFKAKKRQAKALGVVASDWGDDVGFGGFEAASATSEEMREYNDANDWNGVEHWRRSLVDEGARDVVEVQEEVEVDEWNPRLEDLWESVSAVDHEEEKRDMFELWDEIRNGGSRNDQDEVMKKQQQSLMNCEDEGDLSPIEY